MKRAIAAATISALATGAVLATVGFGANSTTATTAKKKSSTRSSQTTQSGPPKTMKQVYDERQAEKVKRDKALAADLGVSVEKLTNAQDTLRKKRLDAEVAANRLTAAQRTAILACEDAPLTCDRSNLPAGGRGGRGDHGPRGDRDQFAKDLAAELGVSQDKVEQALEANRPQRGDGGGPGGHGRGHGHGGPGGPMGGPGFGG